jgi:hypothetical protein
MLIPGSFMHAGSQLLITSCNWTEPELRAHFEPSKGHVDRNVDTIINSSSS